MATDTIKEKIKPKSVFDQVAEMDHEQVVFCHDKVTGLKAIIAIHNTVLGPAMGGIRMWDYATEDEAITDALRLSRGMTFKGAIAGLNMGGGKAVIIGDASKQKNETLMRRFGKFVESLGGRYVTAEDVNMTTRDMEYIRMETRHVAGMSEAMGGSGDPSPITAYGVYIGMKAARKKASGSDNLSGVKVLVQGAGKVGSNLIGYLIKEGAKVSVSDIFEEQLRVICSKVNVEVVQSEKIFDADVDVYAPCALGATLNDESIRKMKCSIVAGGANNQLLDETRHGNMLIDRGIVYAPDFLINGGGITNIYYDYIGNYNKDIVMGHVENIYETCLTVLNRADNDSITPQEAAMASAAERISAIGNIKLSF